MANCEYCGWPAGALAKSHRECANAFRAGAEPAQIRTRVEASMKTLTGPVPAMGIFQIACGVFVGLAIFSLAAGLVYFVVKMIST